LGIEKDTSARAVGGHAELAGGILGESPRIDECAIGIRSQPRDVGNEVGLNIANARVEQAAVVQAFENQMIRASRRAAPRGTNPPEARK
jgi:hypothetical protein